jgi:hypothetical protein
MILDVTIQANGTDYRAQGITVQLPEAVLGVKYNPRESTRVAEIFGDRRKLARTLRDSGYAVTWLSDNPAVALASRVSPARTAASQANGKLSPGRPRSESLLCPEPLRGALMALDKGTLADIVYVAAGNIPDAKLAMAQTSAARALLEPEEVSS